MWSLSSPALQKRTATCSTWHDPEVLTLLLLAIDNLSNKPPTTHVDAHLLCGQTSCVEISGTGEFCIARELCIKVGM